MDVTFSEINRFNVLIGKNNSGKSNLIKIMKFLQDNTKTNEFDKSFLYDSKEDIDAEIILTIELSSIYRKEILENLYQGNYLERVFLVNEVKEGFLQRNERNIKEFIYKIIFL